MNFEIPDFAKHLEFAKNILFYPDNFEFDNNNLENNILENNNIPKIVHIIWVGENDSPTYFNSHILEWKVLMPDWEIRVWKNEDITIEHFPEKIIERINSCIKGAQKADIMRYFIIEKYGGVYVDSDIIPHRSFEPLLKIKDAKIILCHDLELTWQYIINSFFAAEPHHPVFKLACKLCYSFTINTSDIHLHTGPRLLGEAVSCSNDLNDKIILLPSKFFYRNEEYLGRFGFHFYAKNW